MQAGPQPACCCRLTAALRSVTGGIRQENNVNLPIPIPTDSAIRVARGQVLLSAGCSGPVWRVTHGVFKLQRRSADGIALVQLAQAGDLIGVETLCAQPYAFTAVALVAAQAQSAGMPHTLDPLSIMSHGLMQQQRQSCDMLHLRTGPIVQRLAHLLHMLGRQADGRILPLQRKELPTLKEMARVVDASFETVCRELNTLLPERAARATPSATSWVGHLPFALV